jgi:serine/threonine protein kinase
LVLVTVPFLSVHFGSGCFEDAEAAIDHYEFVRERRPSFCTDNASRCLRAVSKLSVSAAGIDQKQPACFSQAPATFDLANWATRLEIKPPREMKNDFLARGTFGTVMRENYPTKSETDAAVKWVTCSTKKQVEAFWRELEVTIKLQHPCIVPVLGWSRGGSNEFGIHMKLATNGSLKDHLAGGKLAHLKVFVDATRQAQLICDIVMGMKHVHSCGFIHGDLKPANILVDENWRALICDFGLCRIGSAERARTPDAGTYDYAAPEQWKAETPCTEKVDVFAFGLVAYEIISGELPVKPTMSTEVREPPASFGPLMRHVIFRCWSLDPTRRPSFVDIFNEFKSSGWAILPKADVTKIAASVSEVTTLEERKLGHC